MDSALAAKAKELNMGKELVQIRAKYPNIDLNKVFNEIKSTNVVGMSKKDMAQVSDVTLDNQGFASFRTELNNILAAINSQHLGTSAPGSVAQGSLWIDSSSSGVLKLMMNDGTDNVELLQLNISTNAITSNMSVTGTIKEADQNAIPFAVALGS